MEEMVDVFNTLPRPLVTAHGRPNHWVFKLRRALADASDVSLVLMQPGNNTQIIVSRLPDGSARTARVLTRDLIGTFVANKCQLAGDPPSGPRAPWSWCTDSEDVAIQVEAELNTIQVREELCNVGMCSEEENKRANELWYKFGLGLTEGKIDCPITFDHTEAVSKALLKFATSADSLMCYSCWKVPGPEDESLKKCSGCGKSWYCSARCQKSSWSLHRSTCLGEEAAAESSAATQRPTGMSEYTYYNYSAHKDPRARELAELMNLSLPDPAHPTGDISYPVRRLAVYRKDTGPNLALFFGPDHGNFLKHWHAEVRLMLVVEPEPGSVAYQTMQEQDVGARRFWPRSATPEEVDTVKRIRKMQEIVRKRPCGPGSADILNAPDSLVNALGQDRPDKFVIFELAVKSLAIPRVVEAYQAARGTWSV